MGKREECSAWAMQVIRAGELSLATDVYSHIEEAAKSAGVEVSRSTVTTSVDDLRRRGRIERVRLNGQTFFTARTPGSRRARSPGEQPSAKLKQIVYRHSKAMLARAPVRTTPAIDPSSSIRATELSTRAINILERAGIGTVRQLVDASNDAVKGLAGMGHKTLQEVIDARLELAAALPAGQEASVSSLIGAALDWAVAEATGAAHGPAYSTSWADAGQLIDSHDIWLSSARSGAVASVQPHTGVVVQAGPTKLVAACRAIVAGKFGATIRVPSEA